MGEGEAMAMKVDRDRTRAIVSKDGAPWCDCGGEVLMIREQDYGKIGVLRGRCLSCNAVVRVKFKAPNP